MNKTSFGFERPEDSPGFLLWQTTITWQRIIKNVLDPFDISHAQFVIMALLLWHEENNQEVTQVEIARLSKLDKMTVSKSLKKLVAQEYIKRGESKKDTRAKWSCFTAAGKELIVQLIPLVERADAEFFANINASDQKELIRILNKNSALQLIQR